MSLIHRRLPIIVVGVALACETPSRPADDTVVQVRVAPDSVILDPAQTQQFVAAGRTRAGDSVAIAVTWSASAGTITPDGMYTADTSAADAVVTATLMGSHVSATSRVRKRRVAQIVLVPAVVTLPAGGTQQFAAWGVRNTGDSVAVAVTYSATGGSIASGGLYTAGQTAGNYRVIARQTNGVLADTAAVTITAANGGGTIPRAGHVFIVTEENTDYASVIGSSSMPYLNGLAQQYGLATQYYANTHPSIGNYFELATGQIITNNDSYSTIVTVDNVVRRLLAAGKTWKSYAEDLPSVGYTGGDVGDYARKHNIFALLSDAVNDTAQRKNLVPFTQFASDLANGALPHYSNIVPNLCNDAHDCALATADNWLRNNIAPLLASATFQQDGLLIITFDEADNDNTYGGGRIAWIVVSPKAKRGYQSTTLYQHQSTLRLTLEALGISLFPGAAATAPAMSEFFAP
jgi:acid phosphatase